MEKHSKYNSILEAVFDITEPRLLNDEERKSMAKFLLDNYDNGRTYEEICESLLKSEPTDLAFEILKIAIDEMNQEKERMEGK